MSCKLLGKIAAVVFLIGLLHLPASAQDKWSWPDKPKNLQVFPKDWTGTRLQPVMVGFTRALGVRCSYCHQGEEGKPLSTYDFASDTNPNKDRARAMLKMLATINDDLKTIQPSGDKRVNMWCTTCHRGRPTPATLDEELGEKYRASGLESTLDLYADLRQKFYGRGSYDFGEDALNNFGYEVLEKDPAGAIEIFRLNAEQFPQSGNVWDSLAEAYMKSGNVKEAEVYYEKALLLAPGDDNAKEQLKKLKESQPK